MPADRAPPDLIVILTDQERAPPPYEPLALTRWRRRALPARRWFDEHGVRLERHYTAATACVPSRPTLLTGHYPDVHGVTQTTGIAKHADDPRIRWLRPGEVPTMGHYLRLAGYDTHYDGKWHVSDADLYDGGEPLPTNDAHGRVLEENVARYLAESPLSPFGFDGWVGPEPHGAARANSGLVRDRLTAHRVVRWLEDRNGRRAAGDRAALRPFLLVVSFVNPHDIVFWPVWARRSPLRPHPLDPPTPPEAPTQYEDLRDKPALQTAMREAYFGMYGPPRLVRASYEHAARAYRSTYMRLHLEVDREIDRVRRAVLAGPRADESVFVLTSDHGEMLGAHGGLHQKWFTLYDEAVRVPFVIAHTGAYGPQGVIVPDVPTSHVDLLPTLLHYAGASEADLRPALARTHSEVHPLPGADLSSLVRGSGAPARRGVYLITRDNIVEGADTRPMAARQLGLRRVPPVARMPLLAHVATNMEAFVTRVPWTEAHGGEGHLWKIVRTFDDPGTWSEPGVRMLASRGVGGDRHRTEPVPDAWELYDLDADPAEADDRARDPGAAEIFGRMQSRLAEERARQVPPRSNPWPYAISLPPGAVSPPSLVRRFVSARGAAPTHRRILAEARVAPSPDAVWQRLADLGAIARWFPDAIHSSLLTEQSAGVGTTRRVQLRGMTLVETVAAWEPGRCLAYDVEGLPPIIAGSRNCWELRPEGSGTRIALSMNVALAPGSVARLLYRAVLRRVLQRSADTLMSSFVAALAVPGVD